MATANYLSLQSIPTQPEFVLPDGELHVWQAGLDVTDDELAPLASLLSADELRRAARFRFERDRRRFVAGRGLLRSILANYLEPIPKPPGTVLFCGVRGTKGDCPPLRGRFWDRLLCVAGSEIDFVYGEHGKPALATAALQFNMAHSEGLAIIGVTRSGQVGIDVERIRPLEDFMQFANGFFSPAERAAIAALPPEDRQLAFFTCWTRKEAYLKATGEGLTTPLDSFDVSVIPGSPPELLHVEGTAHEVDRWSFCNLPLDAGYLGVVAFEDQIDVLRHGVWRHAE